MRLSFPTPTINIGMKRVCVMCDAQNIRGSLVNLTDERRLTTLYCVPVCVLCVY